MKYFRSTKLSECSGFKRVYGQLTFEYVCLNRCQVMGKVHVIFDNPTYVPPYVKKKGAYGADQTEKVGAFRAERMVKVVPLELIELGKMGAFRKSGCF